MGLGRYPCATAGGRTVQEAYAALLTERAAGSATFSTYSDAVVDVIGSARTGVAGMLLDDRRGGPELLTPRPPVL